MTIRNNHKTKYGFSMFEVCVTMAIVVVFIAACTNVFTSRHKARVATYTHGRYECYWAERDDGTFVLQDHLYNESNMIPNSVPISTYTDDNDVSISYCTFRPPVNVKSVVVNAVAAGGNGGANRGGDAGQFTSFYLSNLDRVLSIAPGRSPQNEDETYPSNTRIIQGINTADFANKTIISLNGGRSAVGANDRYFSDCVVAYNPYSCGINPACSIDNNNSTITVSYCIGDVSNSDSGVNFDPSLYKSTTIHYTEPLSEPAAVVTYWENNDGCSSIIAGNHSPYNSQIPAICANDNCSDTTSRLVNYEYKKIFCDATGILHEENVQNTPHPLFNITLKLGGNRLTSGQESEMDGVVNSLKILASENGIASLRNCGTNESGQTLRCRVSTGAGGAAGDDETTTRGGHGSVLITW